MPTKLEGIVDADVELVEIDTLVDEDMEGDWLPDVTPVDEAPDREEVELDDPALETEAVEL